MSRRQIRLFDYLCDADRHAGECHALLAASF